MAALSVAILLSLPDFVFQFDTKQLTCHPYKRMNLFCVLLSPFSSLGLACFSTVSALSCGQTRRREKNNLFFLSVFICVDAVCCCVKQTFFLQKHVSTAFPVTELKLICFFVLHSLGAEKEEYLTD